PVSLHLRCHTYHHRHLHKRYFSLLHPLVRCSCHQCHCKFLMRGDERKHSHHCNQCCWPRSRWVHCRPVLLHLHCHRYHHRHLHKRYFSLLHQLVRCSCHQYHCKFLMRRDE